MTTEFLSPAPIFRSWDNNGNPLVGGQLFTYQAATTTKLASFKDNVGTPNTNPVILNARGEAFLWIPANVAYKYVLAPANDTDPPTNPIWTIDQVTVSGTGSTGLYGGVDTGGVNAYILTFAAPFGAYADGALVYWLPAHNNTTASTVNINAIGVVSITNPDGSALIANQIIASQMAAMIFRGGAFRLLLTGTIPLILPGFTQLNAGTTIPDAAANPFVVGYRDVVQNIQNGNYTTVAADDGKHIYHSDGNPYTWTIAANASVSQPIGATHTFVNDAAGAVNITLAIAGGDTLVWIPSGAAGSRTIAQFGRGTVLKVAATRWWLSGVGIT